MKRLDMPKAVPTSRLLLLRQYRTSAVRTDPLSSEGRGYCEKKTEITVPMPRFHCLGEAMISIRYMSNLLGRPEWKRRQVGRENIEKGGKSSSSWVTLGMLTPNLFHHTHRGLHKTSEQINVGSRVVDRGEHTGLAKSSR